MSNEHTVQKKKIPIALLVITLVTIVGFGGLWWKHKNPPRYVVQKCTEYGPMSESFDGPASIQEMADNSKAIVVATVDSDTLRSKFFAADPVPILKVKETLKGDIRAGGTISICPGMGRGAWPDGQTTTVVAFLENKDGNKWIPLWGSVGVMPQEKDGTFVPVGIPDKSKPLTIDELKELAK